MFVYRNVRADMCVLNRLLVLLPLFRFDMAPSLLCWLFFGSYFRQASGAVGRLLVLLPSFLG